MRVRCAIAIALISGMAARARGEALPCEADDRLADAAATLLLGGAPLDSPALLGAARAQGFDGVTLHARESASDEALRVWLAALGAREQGRLTCGEARSDARRLLLATVRGGKLWRDGDRLHGALEPGFRAPMLVLEGSDGAVAARKTTVEELARGVPIAAESAPARVQLTAETEHGPRPVAELRLGERAPDASARSASVVAAPARAYDAPAASPAALRTPGAAGSTAALLAEIMAFRRSAGAEPVRDNRLLARSAQGHAARVCALGTLAHRLDGEDPEARLAREHIAARGVGEVIARADAPEAALRVLLASPSHRLALSRREFTDVGIGQGRDAKGRTCLVVLLAAWPRRTP